MLFFTLFHCCAHKLIIFGNHNATVQIPVIWLNFFKHYRAANQSLRTTNFKSLFSNTEKGLVTYLKKREKTNLWKKRTLTFFAQKWWFVTHLQEKKNYTGESHLPKKSKKRLTLVFNFLIKGMHKIYSCRLLVSIAILLPQQIWMLQHIKEHRASDFHVI